MCFPSKKQKNNFSDNADKSSKPKEPKTEVPVEPTKAEPAPAATEPTPAAPSTAPELPPVVVEAPIEMAPPKVGIVIYSMYGHIAKCKSYHARNGVANNPFATYSGRGREGWH